VVERLGSRAKDAGRFGSREKDEGRPGSREKDVVGRPRIACKIWSLNKKVENSKI
jgi:hypothetical protein